MFDPSGFDAPATKQAAKLLADWGVDRPVLVVLSPAQERVALSFRNLDRVSVLPSDGVGVADLVGAAHLLVSEEALAQLAARANATAKEEATA